MRFTVLSLLAGLVLGLATSVAMAAVGAEPPTVRDLTELAAGQVGSPAQSAPAPAASAAPAPAAAPAPTPSCTPGPLDERAGQVLLVGLRETQDPDEPLVAEILDAGVAGVLITQANVSTAEQVGALVRGLRRGAQHGLLVATDEEPGRVSSFETLTGALPSARRLARDHSPHEVRAIARELGEELRALGVDLDLAPVADADGGPSSGVIGDRAFSDDPAEAGRYALAFARGLADAGVLPTFKHFPGHGRSAADSHRVLGSVEESLDELRATDVRPFADAIAAGAPVVMLNHVAYAALDPDLPASLSPRAYAFLRALGFEGVAVTDSIGMGAVNLRWGFAEAAVRAIRAGADLVLATDGAQALTMRDALVAAVEGGTLEESRLDEAVARVLALKGRDSRTLVCTDAHRPQLGGLPAPAGVER